MKKNQYDKGVDYLLLEQHQIEVVKYQPWQLGLFHKGVEGKFVWYPKKGTLMFQTIVSLDEVAYSEKIGNTGDFIATDTFYDPSEDVTQRVIDEVLKKVK